MAVIADIFQKIGMYFQYSFVVYALIVGIFIALCSSLLGVTLVLKKFSYIGDGLSHSAFGALAVATVLSFSNNMYFVLAVTIVFAVLLLCKRPSSIVKADAAVGMISVGSLAFGYLFLNIFAPPTNLSGDVCTTLFGSTSILTLTKGEVILSVVLSVSVIIFYAVFYNRIFAITFDEGFSRASGINTRLYNFFMAVIVAVIIVLAMNLVGTLLISALIIFPAVSSMLLFKSFKSVTIFAAIFSVFCAVLGILVAIVAGTPVGSTIVMSDVIAYAVCRIINSYRRHRSLKE